MELALTGMRAGLQADVQAWPGRPRHGPRPCRGDRYSPGATTSPSAAAWYGLREARRSPRRRRDRRASGRPISRRPPRRGAATRSRSQRQGFRDRPSGRGGGALADALGVRRRRPPGCGPAAEGPPRGRREAVRVTDQFGATRLGADPVSLDRARPHIDPPGQGQQDRQALRRRPGGELMTAPMSPLALRLKHAPKSAAVSPVVESCREEGRRQVEARPISGARDGETETWHSRTAGGQGQPRVRVRVYSDRRQGLAQDLGGGQEASEGGGGPLAFRCPSDEARSFITAASSADGLCPSPSTDRRPRA